MSRARDKRKKEQRGKITESLRKEYPSLTEEKLSEVAEAREIMRKLTSRLVRQGKTSRFVLAKDKDGKPLARGRYRNTTTGKLEFVVRKYAPQKSIRSEYRRSYAEGKKNG